MWYPSQQQNSTDQVASFMGLLILIFGGGLAIWWYAPQWVITPVFWVRLHEITLLDAISSLWNKMVLWFQLPIPLIDTHILARLQNYMNLTPPNQVHFNDFRAINHYVGNWLRYPVSVTLVCLAVILHFRHSSSRFRGVHNMQNLRKLESENWPQIKPITPLDLLKEDLDKGPWAMSKLPLDFCKEHHLMGIKEVDGKKQWAIDRGPAQRVFALQLGPLWRGAHCLPIHMKALFVIFCAKAQKDRDIAKQLIRQIAASAESGELDFSGVEELVKKYQHSNIIQWLEKRHAYVYTFMASLLEVARSDGVLASAEFLWLKPVDRRLWYVMNSIGRQTAFVEIAGVFAHWIAEKKVGYAMKTPMIKEALHALEQCMDELLYIEEGERWHISSAA